MRTAKRVKVWRPDLPPPISMPCGTCLRSRAVLFDQIGGGPHPCHWCRREIDWAPRGTPHILEADHLDGDVMNDDVANLVPACRRCNQCRGQGILWLVLQKEAGANHAEIFRWGPIKSVFPVCGHSFTPENIYRVVKTRHHVCLECHRSKAREHWRAKHNVVADREES